MEFYLPWAAHLLHLHPWDIDELTWSQWTRYRDWIASGEWRQKEASDG